VSRSAPNHYAALGLDRGCSTAQIREAYRVFAKQLHPDRNCNSRESVERTQALNAAYEILSDPEKREEYDRGLANAEKNVRSRAAKTEKIFKELLLPMSEFLRGTEREIHINDPGNSSGPESYTLIVPPETAPGMRFRLPRDGGGFVVVRVKPFPHFQFKARGSDLRCDLKINSKVAAQGGEQSIKSLLGSMLRVKIPARVARGEIIRIPHEGLPKPRGGRGDLLVRIVYRPEVRITRTSAR